MTPESNPSGTSEAVERTLESIDVDDPESRSYVRQMISTAAKLGEDDLGHLELKMLTNAMKEIRYAFKVFRQYEDRKKISVFGSSRSDPDDPNYRAAETFARAAAESGYMIVSGGGPGIMEAANKGAGAEHSFGLHIMIPHEYDPNSYIEGDEKCIHFRYFFSRKLIFAKESQAIVYFPGGFGTHDELFELLCLMQTGRHHLAPLVLCDRNGFWEDILSYMHDVMLAHGTIASSDFEFIDYVSDPAEALEVIDRFYRNYHSSRYVGDDFVIRFHTLPSESALDELEDEFSHLCPESGFRVVDGEVDGEEPDAPAEPYRLVFTQTHHDYGELRRLVSYLNDWV